MIDDLKPYPAYREAEGGWIGEIPSHWTVRRMKYVVREIDSRSTTGKEQLLRISQYTGVTQRRRADGLDEPDTRADSLVGYKRVEPNDLVINIMLAWNGSMGVSRHEGITSPAYCVYRFGRELHPWYFHNLLRSPAYKARIKTSSTGVVESRLRLYSDDLGRIEAMLPPLADQKAIVRFLDWANGRLERAIGAKRKVIALLNEQKQAIIHRAVTRGLDPSVPLKPSGIPWLGDIPQHWEVMSIKQICRVFGRIGFRGYTVADLVEPGCGALSLSPGELRDGQISTTNSRYISLEKYEESPEIKIFPGDILFVKTGSTTGKVARVDVLSGPATINPQLVVLKEVRANSKYLAHSLARSYVQAQVQRSMIGGSTPTITQAKIASFKILRPPDAEQAHIVEHVEVACAPAGAAIFRFEREIELLREYRTRLVADVVTGKLDVRAAAARLRDETAPDNAEDEPGLSVETEAADGVAAV